MKKLGNDIWVGFDIPKSTWKRADEIEKQIAKAEESFRFEGKKEIERLEAEALKAYEDARKAEAVGNAEAPLLVLKYRSILESKNCFVSLHQGTVERFRNEGERLVRPFIEQASERIRFELKDIIRQYKCEIPDYRSIGSKGRESKFRGIEDLASGEIFMTIKTNANSILEGQRLLIKYIGSLFAVKSLQLLEATLKEFDDLWGKITWEMEEITVKESEFERLDTSKPSGVAFVTSDQVAILH